MKGARFDAEVRERGGLTVANEIILNCTSCFDVPVKKSERAEEVGGGWESIT